MKHIIFSTVFLLSFSTIFAQIELWQLPGHYNNAVRGDNNCIYLSHGGMDISSGNFPDTLIKVRNDGSIEWQIEYATSIIKILFNGEGVYTIYPTGENVGIVSVSYYDTTGIHKWSYDNIGVTIGTLILDNNITLDQSGNILLITAASDTSYALLKLSKTGSKIFEVEMPAITIRNKSWELINGMFVDNTNKVWVIGKAETNIEKNNVKSSMTAAYQYLFMAKFNGSTGSIILQEKKSWLPIIKKHLSFLERSDEKGNSTQVGSSIDLSPYKLINNSLILYGQYNKVLDNYTSSSEKRKYENLTEWRILIIDSNGKSKMFKYKGKGIDICKDAWESIKDDYEFNIFTDLAYINGNDIYFSGFIANGEAVCGNPELKQGAAFMKFDITKKKPVWIKTFSNQVIGNRITAYSGNILHQIDEYTLHVYDVNGNQGSTVLTFSEPIEKSIPKDINSETGFLYVNVGNWAWWGGDGYFAKYSLPAMKSTITSSVTNYIDEPYEFELNQNYPNPFNPSTTIRFSLPYESNVSLKIYNTLGQEVAKLLNNEIMTEGEQEIEFSAATLPSGVYYYKLEAVSIEDIDETNSLSNERFVKTNKMILIR
ncbi:MAG: T9SS type A sorting domain-containing protein [Bacteroidota bacterium]|nr:T9SS type A sorting domain-containing protein [Bacteroidota bacterium]